MIWAGPVRAYSRGFLPGSIPKPLVDRTAKLVLATKEAVYRIDGKTGQMQMVSDGLLKPSGVCFSPDYKKLYYDWWMDRRCATESGLCRWS